MYMTFGEALLHIKQGGAVSREGWNGTGMKVQAEFPDDHSKMDRPYCYIQDIHKVNTPWTPSSGDLFAYDWIKETN